MQGMSENKLIGNTATGWQAVDPPFLPRDEERSLFVAADLFTDTFLSYKLFSRKAFPGTNIWQSSSCSIQFLFPGMLCMKKVYTDK